MDAKRQWASSFMSSLSIARISSNDPSGAALNLAGSSHLLDDSDRIALNLLHAKATPICALSGEVFAAKLCGPFKDEGIERIRIEMFRRSDSIAYLDFSVRNHRDHIINSGRRFALLNYGFEWGETESGRVLVPTACRVGLLVRKEFSELFSGIGTSLMAIGTRIARERGADHFRVSEVRKDAQGFYERFVTNRVYSSASPILGSDQYSPFHYIFDLAPDLGELLPKVEIVRRNTCRTLM